MSFRGGQLQHNLSRWPAILALLSSLANPIVGFARQPYSLRGLEHIEVRVGVYLDF